jgi:MoaA/NifB/PqqE/SkfB family radical SAM enzyme
MKLINTALGLIYSKFTGAPFYIRFHLTHRCNYRCKMCGQNHNPHQQAKELSLAQIHIVAERVAKLQSRHLVITGGEPFLRSDLPEVIAAFKRHGFSIRIQTNGGPQVTRQVLIKCVLAGLQDISVSIDSLNRNLQDEICQSHDVVDNAIRTLHLSQQTLPQGISLANVVASAYNFFELPDLVRFFAHRGIYTYITPVMINAGQDTSTGHFQFRGRDASFAPESLDPAQCHRILDELIELRRLGSGLTNSTRFLKDYQDYLARGESLRLCEAGTLSLDILPDGSVCLCKEKPPLGNILDPHFSSYFRSPEYHQRVQEITNACRGCFYGEYREPLYALRDFSVFREWVRDWYRTFRHGMSFNKGRPTSLENNIAPILQQPVKHSRSEQDEEKAL